MNLFFRNVRLIVIYLRMSLYKKVSIVILTSLAAKGKSAFSRNAQFLPCSAEGVAVGNILNRPHPTVLVLYSIPLHHGRMVHSEIHWSQLIPNRMDFSQKVEPSKHVIYDQQCTSLLSARVTIMGTSVAK